MECIEPDVERLLDDLRREGSTFEVDRNRGIRATFTRYRGDVLTFPTVLSTSPEHLSAYLERWGGHEAGKTESERRLAAYRILLVNIEEEFDCLAGNPDLIQIGPKDFYVRRTRPRPHDPLDDLPPGDYEWRA
jgi:hypothetical protein